MPAEDNFEVYAASLTSPIIDGFDITPDDGTDLTKVTRGLMVAVGGDVTVVFKGGGTVTLPELSPGVIYPVRVARVLVTGTDATGIVGLY
ncbi:spike base protein, RCAP_Rcc01079 family [Parasedimentitalea psychrophila]|uniref:Uncharacterized protein n=1 Tax=Parasedimentitalea psychrophila TaxID=2997337 RepID=A0A9Y2L0W4_9RHOB|nr:hypothetical protein [Parasedimentitalea psychrophila]WIY26004.1 hypothetical protein QPJ95_03475 [Parasedimentitalea psychrophila]